MPAPWSQRPEVPLQINGVALEYACWGPPPDQAPTLVLLHEGLGCVALWKDLPDLLVAATGFGVLAYSRAGYGASDTTALPRPLNYMTIEAKDVVGAVLETVEVQNAILMGHSDGATIAAIYAGSVFDRRIRGIILLAPHFFTEPEGLAAIRAAGVAYEKGDLRARLGKYHTDVDVAFRGWHDAWTDPEFVDWNVTDVIDHWRVPALVIQGCKDPYGTLAQIEEVSSRIYAPLETLIIQKCAHAPHVEKRKETLAAVSEFCATLHRLECQKVPLG
ncbi:MAG: alpha/beta hydrolase [Sulfitobacter sp.]